VDTLRTVLLVIFVLDCLLLVLAVLIQSGRGGGLAGALGGIGSPDSAFGVRAASQIEKLTGLLGVIFFVLAIALAFIPRAKSGDLPEPKKRGRDELSAVGGTTPPPAGATSPAPKATTSPAAGTGGSE